MLKQSLVLSTVPGNVDRRDLISLLEVLEIIRTVCQKDNVVVWAGMWEENCSEGPSLHVISCLVSTLQFVEAA